MAQKRTYEGVFNALQQIAKDENIDFGLDGYTAETFKQKYFTGPGNIENLYNKLNKITETENIDFGQGTRDEWLASFGYKPSAEEGKYETLSGKRVGGKADLDKYNASKRMPQMAPAQTPTPPTSTTSVDEAPEYPVLGTPWGTQGSGTGDPGTPDYGIPYRPYTQMSAAARDEIYRQNDFAVKQIQQMHDEREKEQARRNQPLVDTGIPEANKGVIRTQGQWEDDLQKGVQDIGKKYVSPMVSQALDKAEKDWYDAMAESSKYAKGEGTELFGLKRANELTDPDKILQGLQTTLKKAYDSPEMKEQLQKQANAAGIPVEDYIQQLVMPTLQQQLESEFTGSMLAKSMPKNAVEYILQGMSNSIGGMLMGSAVETKGQRRIKNQAETMTEEGLNPYYNPGTGAKLTKMGVSFAADAPFFGLYGRVSGQVAKQVAEREIQKLIGKGLSEGAARSIVGSALENSVGARMKNYIMQHVISGSLTMGGYNATSEFARQTRDKEGYDPLKIAGSTAEGLAVGSAFGITGGASQALSQPLSGFSKVGAKLAGFGAEAETMYATEELAKMVHGEEGFTNPFEGSIEALEKLGVMKLSGGHLLESGANKLIRAKEVGAKRVAGETLAELLGPGRTGVKFSEDEQNYIRNSQEGKDLVESLTSMHPDVAIEEVNGKKRFTNAGDQLRRQLSENYDRFMNNTEIPSDVKAKVAKMLGGVYRPGLETGADIIQNEDGSVILKTRDKDGNCIHDIKFDTLEEAQQWQEAAKSEFSRNDAVNMWNNASEEARQNIVNIIKDIVSGKATIDELQNQSAKMMSDAASMIQNRLRRQLGKIDKLAEQIKQTTEQYEGREMTDEEARNYIQTVIRDGSDEMFNEMYQLIHDNAHPADEYNPKRNYWEGQQLSTVDRHIAQVDAQLAEEQLRYYFGDAYAENIIAAADYPDEKIAELASHDISADKLKAAINYYNATAKVVGMMDQALKSIDNQVEAANAYVRKNTHADSGSMIETNYQGRDCYITAGHFQITPDGKLMPTDNSGLVILRDKNTGEIVTANPNDLTVTNISDPNRLIEYNESMEGLRGQLIKQADDSIELHPDTPEMPIEEDYFIGSDGKQYVSMKTVDEQGNPVWMKMAVDADGIATGEPQPLDIEEYRKAKSDALDQAEMPQKEILSPENDQIEQIQPENAQIEGKNAQNQKEIIPEVAGEPKPASSTIPVDESGKKQYEQAKPEDTLAELTKKYGEEKAQQMIAQIAQSTAKALEELQNRDTSKITDMSELEAIQDEIAAAQKKADYWNNLVKPKEDPNANVKGRKQVKKALEKLTEKHDKGDLIGCLNEINTIIKNVKNGEEGAISPEEQAYVDQILKEAKDAGYEVVDLEGKEYNEGGRLTAEFINDPTLPLGTRVISNVKEPLILKDGEMVQKADIIVSQNLGQNEIEELQVEKMDYLKELERLKRANQNDVIKARISEIEAKIAKIDEEIKNILEAENETSVELDQEGKPFISAPNGTTTFGLIDSSKNLDEAPIKLSQGNKSHGYEHMEIRHGKQIRGKGFKTIEDFVDFVAKNYTVIKEGVDEGGNPNGTYLLQAVDSHNNTLYIELSKDGSYWNVNSGGVFRKNYGNKLKTIWSASEVQNKESAPDNTSHPKPNADKANGSNGTISNTVSGGKDTKINNTLQGNQQKKDKNNAENPMVGQEKSKLYQKTVETNTGRSFTFTNNNGGTSVLNLQRINHEGNAVVLRQDYDAQGNPIGEPREEHYPFQKVGNAILTGIWKKQLNADEELRQNFKYHNRKKGDIPIIDVMTNEEKEQMLDALRRGDTEEAGRLEGDILFNHYEDVILRGRDLRNEKVEKALRNGSRAERLRAVRELYKKYPDAVAMLEDGVMEPQSIEEYVADAFGDVPKMGTGFLAYTSYDKGGNKIIGIKDETGFGSRGFGGDTKALNPWLASKGQGISLKQFAEQIRETLPEGLKDQYTDQDIRNIIDNIVRGAEKPTDIANYILSSRIEQAEAAARHAEEELINEGPAFQKVANENSFANRLQRGKDEVNTEPTEKQKDAGNYKKGHISFGGYDYTIENPAGSMRRGTDANGKQWEQKMNNTYGYILGKRGKDGDHLDMFINDKADLDNWNGKVYVVDQINPETGQFDEHKILYGFNSEADAREAYLSNYEKGWKGLGKITGVDKQTFDKWIDSSDRKIKQFADHSIVKHKVEQQMTNFNPAVKELNTRGISIDNPELLDKYGLKNVVLSKTGDHLTLTHFIVDQQGQGYGTRFMEDLARLADEKGWTLALTPGLGFGAKSKKRLADFYKRFGFVPNKGRNADFQTREAMIRRPKDYVEKPEDQEKIIRDAVVEHLKNIGIKVSTDWQLGQKILDDYNKRFEANEEPGDIIKSQKVTPEMKESVMQGQPMFFKTPDGNAYGYTYKGKIYVDPNIATSETPIHEYSHLYCEMKRQTDPEGWNEWKNIMLNDKVVQPIIEHVKRNYEELTKEGKEDDFVEEIITQFSGKRGSERLREVAEEVAKEKGGIFGKAEAITAMQRLKNILNRFWEGVAKMMGWKYTNANQIADRIMSEMLNGVDPTKITKDASGKLSSQAKIERTLMGVHNITEDKLRKAIKLGGLANPSLAVFDSKNYAHTDYGDISLIPRSSLINSKTGGNAGTFTADAWTPTYPRVERRMSDKGQSKFWKDIRSLNDEAGEVANHMRMAFDTWLDKEVGQERLAYWYMKEKGLNPELVLNKNPYGADIVKRIDELTDNGNKDVNQLEPDQIREIADMYHAYKESIGEPVTPAEERIEKLKARIDPNKQTPFTNLQRFRLEELEKYGELLHNLNDFEYGVRRSAFSDGKPNVEATVDKAAKALKDQNLRQDFDKWLEQKAEDYGIEEWLFNGTDNQGRHKYVRNTVENASKLMKKEGLNGAVNWAGIGNWIAKVANKEKTLEGIRKNRKNLQSTREEHDAFRDKWGTLMHDIAIKLGYNGDPWSGEQIMGDILEHKDYAGYLKREYGKTLSEEDRKTIDTFIKEVQTNFPTGYFETKFERPVKLNEFAVAVVPESASPDIVQALKDAGLDVRTYNNTGTIDEQRANRTKATMDAVSGRDDIMFQMVGKEGAAEADRAEGNDERSRNLALAEDSEKAGVDPKAIKLATGWERGADGQWRYEIPDADVDIIDKYNEKYSELAKKGVARPVPTIDLKDLLGKDNELFKYYPELKSMPVQFSETLGNGTSGSFDGNIIKLNAEETVRFDDKDLNNENVYATLLHEVQHAIQDIEGFAKGGSLYTSTTDEGINAIVEKKQRQAADIKLRLDANRKILDNPEELKAAAELEGKSEKEVKDRLLETVDQQAAEYDTLNNQIAYIKHSKAPAKSDAIDLYRRLSGEVESRNVESRMNMTDEERRNSLASETEDVPREDQVIIDGEGGESASIELSAIVDRKITKDEIDKAMNSNLVKRWLKGKGKDQAFNLFGIGSDLIKEMAKARLGINNKYEVDGMFNNTFEAIEHYMKVAREKGLETSIADKYDFHNSDRVKEIMDNGDPLYTDTELAEIGKHLKPEALNDLKEAIKSISENKQIQEEIERIKDYDNGDAVTKAFMLYGIATDRLRKQYIGDERFYRKHTKIVSDDPTRNNIDISNEPNAELREGETTKSEYSLKGSVAKELAKRIATTPLTSNMLALPDDAPKFQLASGPESEMTPEERQYWNQWDADMKKWKERNAIGEAVDGPGEKPRYQQGELATEYGKRLTKWMQDKALWQTAPKIDDYLKKREDKDLLEAARENEKRYPDSPLAKMRRVAAELQQIRTAMSQQKAYDKATVKAVTDFAQDFMKLGFGDNLSRGEIERMLSSVKNATGAKDIKKEVDNIMNILINNHLRNLDQRVTKLSSTKELSKTAQGVEKQGKLELKGQKMIQAFRDARQNRMTADEIRERMEVVAEKMNRNDEEAPMWEQDYEGLSIALQYADNIEASRQEYADLDREYKDAVKEYRTSGRSYKAQQELLEALEQAMQENQIERIGMFGDVIGRLEGNIAESMQGAKEFVEREKQRIKHIHDIANYDLAGKDMGAIHQNDWKKRLSNGTAARFFLSPLATFEQMLRQFGSRNARGEGYLYDHFMRSWMDSVDKSFINEQKAKEELDAKAREVFGNKVKRWSDLYEIERNLPTMDVSIIDQGEEKNFKLNQGNLLYIYMADKMTDGRMKLRKMGIDEEDVQAIKDFLDPRLVELGDWLQKEYLVQKRTEYNKVHERMFGAPMAAIENYFPIKILGDARVQEQDVANVADQDAILPSTITGSIVKRRKNALPLDIIGTDALSLAVEHVEDMERWAAQAEWNKDVNTLLSYTTFRNKVKNMNTIYGSGDQLWNTLANTARMAAGTYRPKVGEGSVDKAISNIAKGVTAAKINFRVYTAFKQILSAPAFLHDVNLGTFVKNSANPYGSWKWAMENMPVFQKRWKSRQVGDTRLMDDPTDWKMWKTNVVQLATRMGMSPNALVDGVTCAVGAKSIYETRYKQYKDIGASDEVARKRALQDAEIGYNLTQQSSEGAFVSAIQKDRTVAANMLSVFRNSSMAYTRQWVDAARNLSHRAQKGYKEDSIHFMTGQLEQRFDLSHEEAEKLAEAEYARAARHDIARLLNMMFGVTTAWNLGASLPYLLFGDDDHTKEEMLKDAAIKGMIAGPTEGLAAGNIYSDFIGRTLASEQTRKTVRSEGWGAGIDAALKQGGDYEVNPLPLMADIQGMIKKMGYDKYAAAQDVFNICMQSAVGVNPQTFTDMWNACMDYGNPKWMPFTKDVGNDDLANSKEIALFIMRLMNAPTSSWRNKYIDELGMNVEDAKKLPYEEMARRYANYKHWKDAPLMGWLRDDESRQAKMEKIQKQFDDAVTERMERLTDEELMHNLGRSVSAEEKRKYAKLIAQRLGLKPGKDSQKAGDNDWYQNTYQKYMLYEDIKEDEVLSEKLRDLRKKKDELSADKKELLKEIEKRVDWINDGKFDTKTGRKGNHKNVSKEPDLLEPGKKQFNLNGDEESNKDAIMKNIRKWRKEALEMVLRAEK